MGLAVGISSGCNFLAGVLARERLGGDPAVVTVFADDNKKYLSTDLMQDEPLGRESLSPEIELLGLTTVRRVCSFCEERV
jgi:cysteine synthase A